MNHLWKVNKIIMSLTEQYDPYENAIQERINRTLKYEYRLKHIIKKENYCVKYQGVNNYSSNFDFEVS